MSEPLTLGKLRDLHEVYKRIGERLAAGVGRWYREGTPVTVYRGGKLFKGKVVAGPNSWSDPAYLLIESHTGWRFRASFRDIEEQP